MKFRLARIAGVLGAMGLVAGMTGSAFSEADSDKLIIEGTEIATEAAAPAGSELDKLYSGWRFRSDETQGLQADDFENPGMTAVDTAAELWTTVDGSAGKSCSSCHNDAAESMKGVRAQYPKWSAKLNKPHTLETQKKLQLFDVNFLN